MKQAVITVVMNTEGKILLLKRTASHMFANQWCFPGGKVDFLSEHEVPSAWRWESHAEAAIRETLEETGIQVRVLVDSDIIVADEHFVVKVFISNVDDYEVTKEFPNREHESYMWLDINDLKVEEGNYVLPDGCGPMTTNVLNLVAIPIATK